MLSLAESRRPFADSHPTISVAKNALYDKIQD
jgi:hypothetical protein